MDRPIMDRPIPSYAGIGWEWPFHGQDRMEGALLWTGLLSPDRWLSVWLSTGRSASCWFGLALGSPSRSVPRELTLGTRLPPVAGGGGGSGRSCASSVVWTTCSACICSCCSTYTRSWSATPVCPQGTHFRLHTRRRVGFPVQCVDA